MVKQKIDEIGNLLLFPIASATQEEIPDDEGWVQQDNPKLAKVPKYAFCGVDFETFFTKKYSMEKMTTWEYVTHQSFDSYLVALWRYEPSDDSWWRWVGHPSKAPWEDVANQVWVSHNASFDALVYKYLQKLGQVSKSVNPRTWHCTADLAAYHQVPRSLEQSMKMLMNVVINKDIRKAMKGGNADAEGLRNYAATDAMGTAHLWAAYSSTWPRVEQICSKAQREAGWYGIYIDEQLALNIIEHMEKVKLEEVKNIPWANRFTVSSTKGIAIECAKRQISPPPSLSLDDPETEAWDKTYGKELDWLHRIKRYTKANQIQGACKLVLEHRRKDGTIAFELLYRKAPHTARWQSGKKIRLQNLDRDPFGGFHIRNVYAARPKKKFVVSDLSQIEPRVLNWLVGDTEFLRACSSGQSPYEAHARSTMGYTNPEPLKKSDPAQYQLAKARTLALGYQAGPVRFIEMARSMCGLTVFLDEKSYSKNGKNFIPEHRVKELQFSANGIDMTKYKVYPSAVDAVKDFRSKSKKITGFWKSIEDEAHRNVGKDWFKVMPNGTVLRYFKLRHEGFHFDKPVVVAYVVRDQNYSKTDLYGGKLTENIVQRIARDVLAEMIARIVTECSGLLRYLWSVHDEIICEVDEARAEEGLQVLNNIMSTPPRWAPDLPVAAEGEILNCYTK